MRGPLGAAFLGRLPEVDTTAGLVDELSARLAAASEAEALRYLKTLTLPDDPGEALAVLGEAFDDEGWHAIGRRIRWWRQMHRRRGRRAGCRT